MRKSVRLSSILCSNTLDDAVPWRHLAMCVQRSSGSAIPLSSDQIKRVLKVARSERYANRAELLLSLSIQLGMRATELASLKWIDIYDSNGAVRPVIAAKRAFLPGKRSQFDISSHPNL